MAVFPSDGSGNPAMAPGGVGRLHMGAVAAWSAPSGPYKALKEDGSPDLDQGRYYTLGDYPPGGRLYRLAAWSGAASVAVPAAGGDVDVWTMQQEAWTAAIAADPDRYRGGALTGITYPAIPGTLALLELSSGIAAGTACQVDGSGRLATGPGTKVARTLQGGSTGDLILCVLLAR